MSKLADQFYAETGTPAINSQYEPDIDYVSWLEAKVNAQKPEESQQLIKDFLRVYVFTVNDDGFPTVPTGEIMALIQRAQKYLTTFSPSKA